MASKLYGVDATIIILVFVLYCILMHSNNKHKLLSFRGAPKDVEGAEEQTRLVSGRGQLVQRQQIMHTLLDSLLTVHKSQEEVHINVLFKVFLQSKINPFKLYVNL